MRPAIGPSKALCLLIDMVFHNRLKSIAYKPCHEELDKLGVIQDINQDRRCLPILMLATCCLSRICDLHIRLILLSCAIEALGDHASYLHRHSTRQRAQLPSCTVHNRIGLSTILYRLRVARFSSRVCIS
jgi:hypothetical protein